MLKKQSERYFYIIDPLINLMRGLVGACKLLYGRVVLRGYLKQCCTRLMDQLINTSTIKLGSMITQLSCFSKLILSI